MYTEKIVKNTAANI